MPATGWEAIGAIATGIGVLVAATTLIPVSRSVIQASKSFRITLLESQQQTYRTERLQRIRHQLQSDELRRRIESDTLDDGERAQLNDLLSFFEFLAILVELKALKFRDVQILFPTAPPRYYPHLKTYIELRQRIDRDLFQNYPKLVALYHRHGQSPRN